MTASLAPAPAPRFARDLGLAIVASLGCGVLAARLALVVSVRVTTVALAALFVLLAVVGACAPVPRLVRAPRSTRALVAATGLGVLAFGAARVLGAGHAPARLTLTAVALNTLAAVAEELWFRRLCFALLEPAGPVLAVIVSSVLFAAVHVPVYGFAVLPLDVAAGLVLGWQRAVTGSWAAPAATHALANVFVLL